MNIKSVPVGSIVIKKREPIRVGDVLKYHNRSMKGLLIVARTNFEKYNLICLEDCNRYFDEKDSLEELQNYMDAKPYFSYDIVTDVTEINVEGY